jgi:hypothetical protein
LQEPFCGVFVEKETWSVTHSISVHGVVDTLKDGDEQRTVEVWAQVTSDTITTSVKYLIGQVRVSLETFVLGR